MAGPYYLRNSDGNNADDGLSWANADANLVAGTLAVLAAGETVYVSHAHAESVAGALAIAFPGTAGSRNKCICANDGAEPPTAVAATATITTTGANGITFSGHVYIVGIIFTCGTSGNPIIQFLNTTAAWAKLEDCSLRLGTGTGTNSRIELGSSNTGTDDSSYEWINTSVQFANASQAISVRARLDWIGGSVSSGGTVCTTLFKSPGSGNSGNAYVRGVDLSAMGSGKSLVDVSIPNHCEFTFSRCKLNASVSITTGSFVGPGGVVVRILNCDGGDTNYRYEMHRYEGSITTETTIVRSGGASDGDTPISLKMVSSANVSYELPLISDPIRFRVTALGSAVTATIEIVNDGVTLTDGEIGVVASYLGTSGFPLSSRVTDVKASILATAANQTSSSVTWTTTGLSSPVKQKLEVTFTPQEKGDVYLWIYLMRASTTVYVCPKVEGLGDSGAQYQIGEFYVNEGDTGGGGGSTSPANLVGSSLVH